MSEHWKSTPKYWCKHCSTYVKDTPLERKQHESTGKHQGNLKRFLNGIQKDHARTEREKDKVKAEVERLNRVAGASAPASSVALAQSSTPSARSSKAASGNLSAADQKRQWAQLADMGIAIPDHARSDVAVPGDWQTLTRKVVNEPEQAVADKLNIGVRKRKFEGQEEEDEAGNAVAPRGWVSSTRAYPGSKPVSEELDALLVAPGFSKKKAAKGGLKDNIKAEPHDLAKPEIATVTPNLKSPEQSILHEDDASTGEERPLQDIKTVSSEHQQETSIPLFKKRRPKHSRS